MTIKDRTNEFNSIIENSRQRISGVNNSSIRINKKLNQKTPNNNNNNNKSQFDILAHQIGRDISITAEKLEQLTKLAKKKSLFEDPSIQIQKLTENINQDIRNLNQQLDFLEVNKPVKKKQTNWRTYHKYIENIEN